MSFIDTNKSLYPKGFLGASSTNIQPVQNNEPASNALTGLVSELLKHNKSKTADGTVLNSSDTSLMGSHLEQYLPTDSLRLEIQMERISESLKETQNQLNALAQLPNSDATQAQIKALESKKQTTIENLNAYKEEYRQISPLHRFALWIKDGLEKTGEIKNKMKKIIYGKQAEYLEAIQTSQTSIEQLANHLSTVTNQPGNESTESNIVNIIAQYDKIDTQFKEAQTNYTQSIFPDLISPVKKQIQLWLYGYEIPKKY